MAHAVDKVAQNLAEIGFNSFGETRLTKAATHLIKARGKLLRPTLVLLGSFCAGGINPLSLKAATAVELIHTASLIHDDLIDRDELRRGVPTVHKLFGEELAVLSGDLLISKAIELSAPCGELAIRELAKAAIDMSEGEARDYEVQNSKRKIGVEEYLDIVKLKTASLIGSSAAIGGIVSGGGADLYSSLREYGFNLGIAFQIRDDYLNVLGLNLDKPKSTGGDMLHGRPNIVAALNTEYDFETSLNVSKELNRMYVVRAQEEAANIGHCGDILTEYSRLVLIDTDTV
ncbi:MAG: polyprenyl synthetase family protein [Thermoprotei archaeon]